MIIIYIKAMQIDYELIKLNRIKWIDLNEERPLSI